MTWFCLHLRQEKLDGYVLQDDLLFRMWTPHGESLSGDSILQIELLMS